MEDRDSWETPQELWNKLDNQYLFIHDCCANSLNTKTKTFSWNFQAMIKAPLMCWMNPPFSNAYNMFKHFFKVVPHGVAIYRCDNMETKVWQEQILSNATWVFIFNKRIQYQGQEGKGARFPSALIGFNVSPPKLTNGHLVRC